jgi:predicted alpha/beta-hydrolase family hydrolase
MAAAIEFPVAVGTSPPAPAAQATTARVYRAPSAHAGLVLAHGAGAPQSHPWMVKAARALSARGLDVVTFDFLYTAARRRAPDRPPVLEETWRAVLGAVRARDDVKTDRLFIGGKSMGGRIATQVAAAGDAGDIRGLVLLGYPLHPPGKPSQLRVAHLPRLKVPALFVQGSRDTFGTPEELAPFVAGLPEGSRVQVIEGGDHSFTRPRSAGETIDAVLDRVADEVARFTS